MIVRVLVEYVDPMDNSLPPQIYIREWKSVEVIPMEWYKILSNPHGYLAKKDDFIEVTEWTNGEGWDITINDKVIPLTRGELDAIDYLTKGLDYDND